MSDENLEINSWSEYQHEVAKSLIPMLEDSEVVAGLYSGKADVKMATEMGYALLMGKPIVIVAVDGAQLPEGLRRAADAVVEGDMGDPETRLKLATALDVILTNSQAKEDTND